MRRLRSRKVAPVLIVAVAGFLGPAPARGQRGDDPMEAFRRRAKEDAVKREKLFEVLRGLPAPPPIPVAEQAVILQERQAVLILQRQAVMIQRQAHRITFEEPGEDEEGPEDAVRAPLLRVLASDNFDRWVFGETGDEASGRSRLETMLAERIERAVRVNGLAPAHRARLQLAGQGDLKRLFDRIDARRAEFESVRRDRRAGARLLQELYPEQTDCQEGPFGRGSLYDKMLSKILREHLGRRESIPTILDR